MKRISWTELLAKRVEGAGNDFGPHSQTVWAAFAAFRETEWLASVGKPFDPSDAADAALLTTWHQTIPIFEDLDDVKYGPNGHLIAPVARVRQTLETPQQHAWWQAARNRAVNYTGYTSYIPHELESLHSTIRERSLDEMIGEYMYEFVSWLLAEILTNDPNVTYFRQQLEWFHAGRFPAGWDGAWPQGRMRVY